MKRLKYASQLLFMLSVVVLTSDIAIEVLSGRVNVPS